ncbi:Retrovirus-related Pol polyprotein from transposon 412 family [Gossypium australe]|uniref:Retrovirus-related Pol polyprotein from transposon 412 family n=1 Tax=Gossypium australe TaxID=47621 RepID=A0A5B6WUC8_9ROSI|nr:Retrovirus-related Pol polyprotein from transposon 412 family [Gossypium australe]
MSYISMQGTFWQKRDSPKAVDYISKWVEAVTLPTNDTKLVVRFLRKNIFARFGTTLALILEKIVNPSWNDWEAMLDTTLWAYITTYKTPLCMFLYKLVYGKNCHIPIKLEKKAYWEIKELNLDPELTKKKKDYSNYKNWKKFVL